MTEDFKRFKRSKPSMAPSPSDSSQPRSAQWISFPRLGLRVPLDSRYSLAVTPASASPSSASSTYSIEALANHHQQKDQQDIGHYTYTPSSSPSLNFLLGAMAETMAFFDAMDVYTPQPTQSLDALIDNFLQKHGGRSYKAFARTVDVRAITGNDYGSITPRLRRRLFDYRAKVYLAALAAAEREGHDLGLLLSEVSDATILPLKKEKDEPTFTSLRAYLKTT